MLHEDCMCTFQTLTALSTQLSRYHTLAHSSSSGQSQEPVISKCPLCTFQHPISESVAFSHIRKHFKKHETVVRPYKDCNYSNSNNISDSTLNEVVSAVVDCNVVCTATVQRCRVDLFQVKKDQ